MSEVWEISRTKIDAALPARATCLPGWEPFSVSEGWLWLRRRVAEMPAEPLVARVLTPPERAEQQGREMWQRWYYV